MHELSLCRGLLRIIEKKMTELNNSSKQVTAIWLEVSLLCGVDVNSLEFYFTFVSKNTLAETRIGYCHDSYGGSMDGSANKMLI